MSCLKAAEERRKTGSLGADRMNLQGKTDWSTLLKETDWKNRWGGTREKDSECYIQSLFPFFMWVCLQHTHTHTHRRLHQAAITHHHPTKTHRERGRGVLPPSAQKQQRRSLVCRLTWTHACLPPLNRSSFFCDVTV